MANARPLISESNRRWADKAPLLIFTFARRNNPETGKPLRTAFFDTGAAWLSLALQAHKLGLATRAMGGILHDKTYEALGVPREEFESVAGIAVGYPAPRESLHADLQERELPNPRRAVSEFAFKGRYQP